MDIQQAIAEQLKIIPENLLAYVKSNKWLELVSEISNNKNLNPDQEKQLQNEVLFVLLGIELSSKLAENIVSSLKVNGVVGYDLSKEIDSKIISQFKDILPTEEEEQVEEGVKNEEPNQKATHSAPPDNLPAAEHLIEDTEGNKDNVVDLRSTTHDRQQTTDYVTDNKETEPHDLQQTTNNTPRTQESKDKDQEPAGETVQNWGTVVDRKLEEKTAGEKTWEEKKGTVLENNVIVKSDYPENHDPYREPIS